MPKKKVTKTKKSKTSLIAKKHPVGNYQKALADILNSS